jgi:hypothetical protein
MERGGRAQLEGHGEVVKMTCTPALELWRRQRQRSTKPRALSAFAELTSRSYARVQAPDERHTELYGHWFAAKSRRSNSRHSFPLRWAAVASTPLLGEALWSQRGTSTILTVLKFDAIMTVPIQSAYSTVQMLGVGVALDRLL